MGAISLGVLCAFSAASVFIQAHSTQRPRRTRRAHKEKPLPRDGRPSFNICCSHWKIPTQWPRHGRAERRIQERTLRQSQKLESIGQLAVGIAHEINTPTQCVGDITRFLEDAFGDLRTALEKSRR